MILADKIINERKRNGWSQEEFADMLGVSRQAVSKWEGAQSTPDLQRIIQMAELFGVSTDYLLKDEVELPEVLESSGRELDENARRFVTMEEANAFLDLKKKTAPAIARGVVLCILSPALLILLIGLSGEEGSRIAGSLATGVGLFVLLGMVAVAVYTFIVNGSRMSEFDYIHQEAIETAYGVSGMVKERKKEYAPYMNSRIAIGVILCIFSPLALIIVSLAETPDYFIYVMVDVLLMMVAAGVYIMVSVSALGSAYDMLLEEGEFTASNKENSKKIAPLASIYWSLVTAAYLGWSIWTGRWEFTWIVWAVAGVLFGAVSGIYKVLTKDR